VGTTAGNAFIGRKSAPTEADLTEALGPARPLWDDLTAGLASEYGIEPEEWSSYSPKAGWSLPLRLGKRRIVYLSPCRHCFRASFALGDKAVAAARKGHLPGRVLKLLDQAKRYAEGTALRIEVRGPGDVRVVKQLAAIKLAN